MKLINAKEIIYSVSVKARYKYTTRRRSILAVYHVMKSSDLLSTWSVSYRRQRDQEQCTSSNHSRIQ